MARPVLHYQQLNKKWWGEAVMTAAYLLNRFPNTVHRDTSPYEVVYGVTSDLGNWHVFGSRGFVHVDKSRRSKWDSKAHGCIFLGYAPGSKAYGVWYDEDQRLVTTRTIRLDERGAPAYRDVPDQVGDFVPQVLDIDPDVTSGSVPAVIPAPQVDITVEYIEMEEAPIDMEVDEARFPQHDQVAVYRQASQHEQWTSGEAELSASALPTSMPQPQLRPASSEQGDNRMVFRDAHVRGRTCYDLPRILPCSPLRDQLQHEPLTLPPIERPATREPLLLETPRSPSPSVTSDDIIEPDPKRPRTSDGYCRR
ncbi:polyprotein [Phytophthora megakarya]|uniref:Polyprotein n=1 Tax=Phytophthora megakarya TaxID=4795 RepID=A0A225W7Z6_9STRA|nr:polyprotein [Phytophthora megakarya]